MKATPQDQNERDRFATQIDKNFSVVAAAGTGKTTAITKRIVEIAIKKPEWLPRLVVVTFTNRAADEMQQRARQEIFDVMGNRGLSVDVLTMFNRAFFGTIHSFCTKLLAAHGHHLGLPRRLDVISDDQELWSEFVQRADSVGETLSPENRKALFRCVQVRDLMELGRRSELPLSFVHTDATCPRTINIDQVDSYPGGGVNILADQQALRDWKERFEGDCDFCPLVERTSGAVNFAEAWENALRDFNEWLSCCALKVAADVQANYRQFRAERGAVTFDDQIAFALQLTTNREAISRIRDKDYIVILDEAQDTDPQQFSILTEVTRPREATGCWIDTDTLQDPPRSGRFCMVGDFQQSIYGDRANLGQYQRIHRALIKSDAGEEVTFSVTFRLDETLVEFVSKCFRDILNEADQVGFVPLKARPDPLPGQVVRLDITADVLRQNPSASDTEKARVEAAQLAMWLKQTDYQRLRARGWKEVAVLCPRKKWFRPMATALRQIGIESQIQSETDVKGDSPAHAWFAALVTIMTQPRDAFEIVGVLREVFGISDHELAVFSGGFGDRFQIETVTGGIDTVSKTIDCLAGIHCDVANMPLFTAVEHIVDASQLRERLRILPTDEFDSLDAELDVLVQSAATAEAEGATLEEFAELLRSNFTTEREASAPRAGAIQLITCQKAKGLQWDAVIVPFFSRRIYTADDNFPRLIATPPLRQLRVAFSEGDVPKAVREALKKAQQREMERLLYVALTRARHTLVIADDRALFANALGNVPSASLTTWFRSDHGQTNEVHIAGLQASSAASTETSAEQLNFADINDGGLRLAQLPQVSLGSARTRAEEFAHKISPSSLIHAEPALDSTGAERWKETENEFRAATFPSAALRYGLWWHEFIQQVPWHADAVAWDALFETAQASSPKKARSAREWGLLRRRIAKLSDFPRLVVNGDVVAHAEMPFLWRMSENACLEGIVDLAVFQADKKSALILDWKTNELASDKIDNLRSHYCRQLAAYWKAVTEMTGATICAAIYSTSLGEFIVYDGEELEMEWSRL